MIIRLATSADVAEIRTLVMSLSHLYLKDNRDELPSWFRNSLTQESFQQRLDSTDYVNFVGVIDNELVGYLAMKRPSHLYHLFVSQQHQGKGLARAFWQHAMNQCRADVYTLNSSLYAVPVYRKFGFIESAEVGEKDGIGFQPMTLVANTAH